MVRHLLVTNDYPPKVGGIQNYLWELWRRLPVGDPLVHTTPYQGADDFDAEHPHLVVRSREKWLLPHPWLARRVDRLAAEHGANLVVLDPAVPAGLVGPHLKTPYAVVLHGAEVAIPGRVPGLRRLLNRVLGGAVGAIAAGGYPAAEAQRSLGRSLPTTVVPPGVDTDRFVPLDDQTRAAVRAHHGVAEDAALIVSVSRLVPRKGMDTLIRAAAQMRGDWPDLTVLIAGRGRDRRRLERLVKRLDAPVRLLGRLPDGEVEALYGAGDVFAMLCRSRWAGLEQEGFGIVFLEAAAAGVPQVAGRSGGAHEAVVHNETGLVVDDPRNVDMVADALSELLSDPRRRSDMASAGRQRAEAEFSYDRLAARLGAALDDLARSDD